MKKRIILLVGLFLLAILLLMIVNPATLQGFIFSKFTSNKITEQKSTITPSPTAQVQVFDKNGRVTDTARSLAKTVPLDLSKLTKIHPENVGNNYYVPGTYTLKAGDGIGNGAFLIKVMEVVKINGNYNSYIRAEVFKKESDGNYYHYPTDKYDITLITANQLFDINIEIVMLDYEGDIIPGEVNIIYHPSCQTFIDYCDDANSDMYTGGDTYINMGGDAFAAYVCNGRCPFTANDDEYKAQNGKYSAVFPKGYKAMTDKSLKIIEQCDKNTQDFLKFNPDKPRIGLKMILGGENQEFTGHDEYVSNSWTSSTFDSFNGTFYNEEMKAKTTKCPDIFALGHELTHVNTKEFFGASEVTIFGLNEGLADFARIQNLTGTSPIICEQDGWRYNGDPPDITYPYVDLAGHPSEDTPRSDFYRTGYCFWQDFTKEYGYNSFVKLMQSLYQKVRDIKSYYVLDVMQDAAGGKIKPEILNRYSLKKEKTLVKVCEGCEKFLVR